jgi:DNA polymerase-1
LQSCDSLPNLENVSTIALDTEHKGLGPDATLVGVSLATCDAEWYLPCAHPSGRQHAPETLRAYLHDALTYKRVIFRAAKNDLNVLKRWGLDLEELGVEPHEVQHAAALLDEHRRHFSLDELARDKLGQGKIVPLYYGKEVPAYEIPHLPAHAAAPYARRDARITYDLHQAYEKDIVKDGLDKVLDLEDKLIYCTLAMENARVKLDKLKLERWIGEVHNAYAERILEVHRRTGLRVNPNSANDVAKLFKYLGEGWHKTPKGKPSFTDDYLHKFDDVPEIRMVSEARDLDSLLTKYLVKYHQASPGGFLAYQLHQLRAEEEGANFGTITGRYASSKVNIQQVFKPDKQVVQSPVTAPWIIRELFIPGSDNGWLMRFTVHDEVNGDFDGRWFHSDASQIEYRLFAHFSCVPHKSTRLIDAYNKNPKMSYHKFVHEEILKKCMIYSHAKNFNFMKLYGGGLDKAAFMLGTDDLDHVQELLDQYDAALPEAKDLLQYCSRLAERRSFVRTILGRRRRYLPGDRFYSALNSVLQGSAADLMKLKLLRLYNERNNVKTFKDVVECHAVQEFPLRVPITWECSLGSNWKETS